MQTYRPAFHTWNIDGKRFVDPHMAEDSEGLYYLAAEADKRIAELESALRESPCRCRQGAYGEADTKCARCVALSL